MLQVISAAPPPFRCFSVSISPASISNCFITVTEDRKKPEKLTLTVQEAANLIGISKPKMYELLYSREIAHKRIGKKIVISYKVIDDWVNDNQSNRKPCQSRGVIIDDKYAKDMQL